MKWEYFFEMWPPSVNHMWKHGGWNGPYQSRQLKLFKRDVKAELELARWRRIIPCAPLAGPVAVTMRFYPPDKGKHDLDNLPKALFDAFTAAGVWEDDIQVKECHSYMCEPCGKPGGIFVCLQTLG